MQTGGGVAGALVWPAGQTAARLYVPEYAPLDGELAKAAGLGAPGFRSTGQPSFAVYALPVSYTHLDVYKRQGLGGGWRNWRRPGGPRCWSCGRSTASSGARSPLSHLS